MRINKIILVCLIFFLLLPTIFSTDYLAADKIVTQYRTGKIDPVSANVPKSLQEKVFSNPNKYLVELVNYLTKNTNDDYLKVKRIHDWITNNIAYDYDLFLGVSDQSGCDPENVLQFQRTVCTGFAKLFRRMAELAGIEAVEIPGYTKTYRVKSNKHIGGHKWNGVKINGKWYLVDCSHDNRMSYESNTIGKKEDYHDTHLFIDPEAKILINFPKEEKYQFTKKHYTNEEFITFPQVRQIFKAYNVKFVSDMSKIITKKYEDRKGGHLQSIIDFVKLKNGIATIVLNAPENVLIYEVVKDQDYNRYNYNSISYRDGENTICKFSAPSSGKYIIYIMAKYLNDELFHTIYKCYIEAKEKGPILPVTENKLLYNTRFFTNGLKLIDNSFSGGNGIYYLKIAYPKDTMISTKLLDINGKSYQDNISMSFTKNGKAYFYSLPSKDTYFIKLYSKKKQDDGNRRYTGIVKIHTDKVNALIPSVNYLMFREKFLKNNFTLIHENVSTGGQNGIYTVTIKAPPQFRMACNLKDENNNRLRGFYKTNKNNNTYTFTITNPHKGRYKTKIFQIDSNEKYYTVAYFYIQ